MSGAEDIPDVDALPIEERAFVLMMFDMADRLEALSPYFTGNSRFGIEAVRKMALMMAAAVALVTPPR